MADWSPTQYLKFADERTRAARDLLAQVPLDRAGKVFDLGCGPGNSTALLIERFTDAEVTGVDSSPDMLAKAREALPQARFIAGDLSDWQPEEGTDLLFANALFQWVPHHLKVVQRLLTALPKGGVLAIQMPDNLMEPSHVAMREVAASGPWAAKLKHDGREALPQASTYYDALKPHAIRVDIWHTIYNHPIDGAKGIVEWVKGTGLRPFIDPLDENERRGYLAAYEARIAKAYPLMRDGKALLRFPRLFILCVK
ncbi:trans-aconitate 2-methyltransferase [Nordella sp. HKS 07]|uniref:trans-aconitate 2-methyltransferase n=1 Tax=Nordella sp. HKS 07 TaxID=2712222 RepID=UPI0013E1BD31|nr:trans-aconitate 2-methyltransferase [Nordella sp. HKS 07]QIG51995.1 trans-aconitate 2-methyltransferase [Nordella sp. HKS 07]